MTDPVRGPAEPTPASAGAGAPLIAALAASDTSTRLKAALAAGTCPELELIDTLMGRCAIEPDFCVRDMLTWALTRLPSEVVVPGLLTALQSEVAQARGQALHTLPKIRDAGTWSAITPSLLRDPDDEVARSAWRAAVVLVPESQRKELAAVLASQLGRGDRSLQLSLSRALVALGAEAAEAVLRRAMAGDNLTVRAHAGVTEKLLRNPEAAFEPDLNEAKRVFVLSKER